MYVLCIIGCHLYWICTVRKKSVGQSKEPWGTQNWNSVEWDRNLPTWTEFVFSKRHQLGI